MTRRFLIDTDTASDDAVALVLALRHPDVVVDAVTVVAGNVPLDMAVQNALYTVELCAAHGARTPPVYAGSATPLLRALDTAQYVHGEDGMGDIGLPLTGRVATPGHAVDELVRRIMDAPGEITLVTLGPLTNLALAVRREPAIVSALNRLVVMGGVGEGYGNVTPVSEYNLWADPEAAAIVFDAGFALEMVGWDISYKYATFNGDDAAAWRAVGGELAAFCIDIQAVVDAFARRETKLSGFDLPDPIAMAIALDPSIATRVVERFVAIETQGEWARGQTIVDHLSFTGRPTNTKVVLEADRGRFLALLHDACRV
jgi:purine nucleosidase